MPQYPAVTLGSLGMVGALREPYRAGPVSESLPATSMGCSCPKGRLRHEEQVGTPVSLQDRRASRTTCEALAGVPLNAGPGQSPDSSPGPGSLSPALGALLGGAGDPGHISLWSGRLHSPSPRPEALCVQMCVHLHICPHKHRPHVFHVWMSHRSTHAPSFIYVHM